MSKRALKSKHKAPIHALPRSLSLIAPLMIPLMPPLISPLLFCPAVITTGDLLAVTPASATPAPLELGTIEADAFDRYLARGPQSFIASIRVLPARKNGAFVGFKLTQIAPGSPVDLGGLKVGDVVLRVNGLPIGRPEEWMRAWALVGQQRRVEVEVLRVDVLHRWLWGVAK